MSNLYKGAFVSREEKGSVIIDANELFEKRLEEKRQKERLRALSARAGQQASPEEDFEALDPEQLEQLTADQDTLGEAPADEEEDGTFREGIVQAESPAEGEPVSAEAAKQALAEVQAEADRILADAQTQAEALRSNAVQQGHDEGYNAGYAEAAASFAAQEAALAEKERELEENYRKLVESAEPEMVDALTRIYEHIFAVRLADDKSVILHLLQQTLSRAEPTGDFLIHTSSADYEAVIDAKDELREMIPNPNCHLEVVEDTFLKENECMIETDGGVFDCGLGTEMSELAKKLKLLAWQA